MKNLPFMLVIKELASIVEMSIYFQIAQNQKIRFESRQTSRNSEKGLTVNRKKIQIIIITDRRQKPRWVEARQENFPHHQQMKVIEELLMVNQCIS